MTMVGFRAGLVGLVTFVLAGCVTSPRYASEEKGEEGHGGVFSRVSYHLDEAAEQAQPDCLVLLPLALSREAAEPLSLNLAGPSTVERSGESLLDLPGATTAGFKGGAGSLAQPTPYRGYFDAQAKRRLVRQMLYGFISPHRPRDVELGRVDEATGGFPVTNPARYRLLGRQLGCNWLLTGRITDFDVDYFGIYSNIRIGAELQLIQASTGKVLWSGRHLAQSRDGAVPLSPIDLAVGAVKAAGNLSPDQLEAVVADLARRLVRTMPLEADNPFLVAARRNRIYQVVARSLNLRQGPGTRYAVRRVLRGAERVSVLEAAKGSSWYRVQTRDGAVGYAARRFLRPVIDSASQETKNRPHAG